MHQYLYATLYRVMQILYVVIVHYINKLRYKILVILLPIIISRTIFELKFLYYFFVAGRLRGGALLLNCICDDNTLKNHVINMRYLYTIYLCLPMLIHTSITQLPNPLMLTTLLIQPLCSTLPYVYTLWVYGCWTSLHNTS
jgi:hypothetical protein